MEREILFRGKRVDDGQWVYGCYYELDMGKVMISTCIKREAYEVQHETVGQFTGLTDKNGKKIFEGDIVRRFNSKEQEVMCYAVKWNTDCCMFVLMCEYTYLGEYDSDFTVFYGEDLEVVGNVHDNLDFMKDDEDF